MLILSLVPFFGGKVNLVSLTRQLVVTKEEKEKKLLFLLFLKTKFLLRKDEIERRRCAIFWYLLIFRMLLFQTSWTSWKLEGEILVKFNIEKKTWISIFRKTIFLPELYFFVRSSRLASKGNNTSSSFATDVVISFYEKKLKTLQQTIYKQ